MARKDLDVIELALQPRVERKREEILQQKEKINKIELDSLKHKEHAKLIMAELTRAPIDLTEYTGSKSDWRKFIEYMYSKIKEGYEFEFFRRYPIEFTFQPDGDVYTLPFAHFITNIMLWQGIVRLEPSSLDESHIVDCSKINNDLINDYLNNKVVIPFRGSEDSKKINIICHDIKFDLGRQSSDFNIIIGITINIETFIDLAERFPRFGEILRTQINDDMQPSDIEQYVEKLNEEQIAIVMNDPQYNPLKAIFSSGTGIKKDQFRELVVNAGLKSDLSGVTIPEPINGNFIMSGLNDIRSYYIDAVGGRKPLVVNATKMGDSGYFAKLMSLLSGDFRIRQDGVEDCGTVNMLRLYMRDAKMVEKYRHRYYRRANDTRLQVMRGDETELIGEYIYVRSPSKCASVGHEGCCKLCYGEMYYTNKDLESPGILSAVRITNPVGQTVLSTKHMNATNSNRITFNEEFYDYFSLRSNEITINPDNDLSDVYIAIKKVDMTLLEESDSGIDSYVYRFYIVDVATKKVIEVSELNENMIYLNSTLKTEFMDYSRRKKGKLFLKEYFEEDTEFIELDLGEVDVSSVLFIVDIQNNEKTKPLVDIKSLIDFRKLRQSKGIDNDVDGIIQSFIELIIDSGVVHVDAIHVEVIITQLTRAKDDILERPDFRRYDAASNTQVLTLKQALKYNPSVTVSLTFEDYTRQFISSVTYRKTRGSYMDNMYRKTLANPK